MGSQKERPNWQNPFYSFREEVANSVTHGFGVALAVIGMVTLLILGFVYGDGWQVISFAVYGISLVIVYLASTLYHGIQQPSAKKVLRHFDHTAIYIFIAGTYTPFLLIGIQGVMGWTILAIVWVMAAAGILWKIFFLGRFNVLDTILYLFMGWMGVMAFRSLLVNIPLTGVILLLAGGVVYSAGVIFYAWNKLPFNHAIWHLFVMGGSICHYFAIVTLIPAR